MCVCERERERGMTGDTELETKNEIEDRDKKYMCGGENKEEKKKKKKNVLMKKKDGDKGK